MNPLDYRPPVWLLVDANNQIVTTAYGFRGNALAAPAVVNDRLAQLVDRFQPSKTIIAFDSGETFRHQLLPTYKSGRTRLPDIDKAIASAKRLFKKSGYTVFVAPGFEADDILATCAKDATEAGCRAVIYSADKDLHQCIVAGEVSQLTRAAAKPNGAFEFSWKTATDLFVSNQVTPAQWVDFKCLVGDPSDKIEGVDLIGAQTAGRLLSDCGSIDGFYKNPFLAALSDRQRVNLINAKPRMDLLRTLCTLRRDVPLEAA